MARLYTIHPLSSAYPYLRCGDDILSRETKTSLSLRGIIPSEFPGSSPGPSPSGTFPEKLLTLPLRKSSHPVEKTTFSCLYPWSCSFGHYPWTRPQGTWTPPLEAATRSQPRKWIPPFSARKGWKDYIIIKYIIFWTFSVWKCFKLVVRKKNNSLNHLDY